MRLVEYIRHNYDKDFKASDLPFDVVQKKVKKGTIIQTYGKMGDKMHFLNQGIIETTIAYREKEKILSFYFSHAFFSAYASALTEESSKVQMTAITDCILETFLIKDFRMACETSFLMNKIGRIEIEKRYIHKNQREMDFVTKTTEEMYLDLIENNPEVLQNIPLKKIANYLGVLPETLSRIRRRIIS